jgi:hypothetical protein
MRSRLRTVPVELGKERGKIAAKCAVRDFDDFFVILKGSLGD